MSRQFLSEPLTPVPGSGDRVGASHAQPGLPRQFDLHGRRYTVAEVLRCWKQSTREGHSPTGELYLRRHYWQIRTTDGVTMTLYCLRQARKGKPNWFVYTIDDETPETS